MSADLKEVLKTLLNEIEDLRAWQLTLSSALTTLPDFAQTNLPKIQKDSALAVNQSGYEALRQAIDELS